MGEHVVGDDERSRLDLVASQLEQLLVVVLLGVEEDEVEDVVDLRQRLERVAFDQLDRLLEPRLGHVAPPGLDLRRIRLSSESTRPPR